ncbi:MAG TPA: helix-turn-helix domain-containing protein [Candidatus Limnocylindrales bacterium]|jgi:tetratricopeptide (TPR) repeat protein
MSAVRTRRRRVVTDDRQLARTIGERIRKARLAAGLTQQQLAGDRYTKAYISALENGIARPSMVALDYLAPRLGTTAAEILADPGPAWARLEADIALASGRWTDAYDGYLALLESAEERGTRADLLAGMAETLCKLDRPSEAIGPASEAARTFAALGREADRARAEYTLASAENMQDNPEEARGLLRSVLERTRNGLELDAAFQTRLLIALAMVESFQGEAAAALGYLEEARDLAGELDARRQGAFLASLATAYRAAGDLEGAIATGLKALTLLRAAESELEAGFVENHLALAYLANGNATRALDVVRRARDITAHRGDERLAAHLADTEAAVTLAMGDAKRSLELADEAIALSERSENRKALLDALVTRARALSELRDGDEAVATFQRAADLARETAPPSRVRQILGTWAETLATLGRHDEAYVLAREALGTR